MHDNYPGVIRQAAATMEADPASAVRIPESTATAQRLAMELDERRRVPADKIVKQYTRGLLSVEDLAMEIVCILGEVQ